MSNFDGGYDIKNVDVSNLKGAFISGNNIKIYQLCVYLSIRVIGFGESQFFNTINELNDFIENEFFGITDVDPTIIIFDAADISDEISDESIIDLYDNYFKRGIVVYIYNHTSKPLAYLMYAVNEFRSVDNNFC